MADFVERVIQFSERKSSWGKLLVHSEGGCWKLKSTAEPPWRNWLARSAVNRKVGGSSPPGGAIFFSFSFPFLTTPNAFGICQGPVQHVFEPLEQLDTRPNCLWSLLSQFP